MSSDYRTRIYEHYVSSGQSDAPESIDGLQGRAAFARDMIAEHFPPDRGATILDIGCGYGAILYSARQAGYQRLMGVDVSAEQVDAARRLGIEGVVQGDLLATLAGLPEASQDVVIAFDVIEHLTREDLIPVVDAVNRVLKSGGRWIINVPNGESPLFGRARYGDLTHEIAFTRFSLSPLLLASGFRRVEFFENAPRFRGMLGAVRWGVWKLIRAALRLYIAAESGDTGRNAIFTQNMLVVAWR